MNSIATKRIQKDLNLLEKNKDDLSQRGIHWCADESNLFRIYIMIVGASKRDGDLISPYEDGMFFFELTIPQDYPLSPPRVSFSPKQSIARLHPNYYENGKVCLSMINTWGAEDWSASMSLLSLANVLEERFNERSLCFEPGRECEASSTLKAFNEFVRAAVLDLAIARVLEGAYPEYAIFARAIDDHWRARKNAVIASCPDETIKTIKQPFYNHTMRVDFRSIRSRLERDQRSSS